MQIIASSDNAKIKQVRTLIKDKKERRNKSLFVIEGATLYGETPSFLIKEVFVREGDDDMLALAETKCSAVYTLKASLFDSVCDTVSPSGILAIVSKQVKDGSYGNKIMVLDGVQDPGNVGTIVRSAVGFSYDDVILIDSADVYSPKVVRSAMGAVFKIGITECDREEAIKILADYEVFALDMSGENIKQAQIPTSFALVVGNEGSGISQEILNRANKTFSIDANGIESLNAAVAASIAMFQFSK